MNHTQRIRWMGCALPLIAAGSFIIVFQRVVAQPDTAPQATTITVNWAADVRANDGHCTLREAVIAANTDTQSGAASGECPAGSGADRIVVPAGSYTLTIGGNLEDNALTGDLDMTGTLTINGAGPTATRVDAHGIDRVFDLLPSAKATLAQMTIQGGCEDQGFGGGGILNRGALTLNNALLIANYTNVSGGGLNNSGSAAATLNNVSFGNNQARDGAGIRNAGAITLTHTSLTFGAAYRRGGGMKNEGIALLNEVNISANTAITEGGGIYNTGVLSLNGVTIDHNQVFTNGEGGGLWNGLGGSANLVNTTLSANDVLAGDGSPSGNGGGIYFSVAGGTISLTNVTLAYNSAGLGGGIHSSPAGVTLKNTIIAYSHNSKGGNCRGTLTSHGYNLSSDNTCATLAQPGDQNNQDPLLDPLANNDGWTETHALQAGSPAMETGTNSGCPSRDQRGYPRPADGDANGTTTCDIGAYEKQLYLYLPLVRRN